jgi:predicted phage terminase large subunit-like protein
MALDVWDAVLEHFTARPDRWPTPGALAAELDRRTVRTPALDLIDTELADLLDQPDGRLIISMPPQEGKSTRVAKDFVVWALTRNPDLRIVTASYAQGLANRNGRSVRNLIQANPQIGLAIAPDNGAASEWTLAGHEGGVLSVGRGAGVTGRPADMLVIDDPIKDRNEADSRTIRDTCWDWWTDSLSTRLAPGAPVVLILTRWHEDDLAGRLLAAEDGHLWRVINIPAQAEGPDDPLGRAPGEYLESARGRTPAQWDAIRVRVGAQTWASLYQGHPSPPDGGLFRRDVWRRWTKLPDLAGATVVQSWDLAFKDTKTADFVVGQVWAQIGADCYLLDQVRGRWGFTETCDEILNLSAKWPQATAKYVEDKANGPAVIDALRHRVPGLIPVNPEGGKEARAAAVSPLVEAGNVHLPARAPWVDGLIEEAAAFPNGTNDDQVDALTQALTKLMITRNAKATTQSYDIG